MVAKASPWLFVSDVHLDPLSKHGLPSRRGSDTNEALLLSALAEMKRVDPAPPVVVIPGDFVGHGFVAPYARATLARVAQAFGRAFPRAQFVLALGNEDSDCGDYAAGPDAPILRATVAAWAPLVNRHGEAPNFRTTFAHDGFYVTRLPLRGVRAVVFDDIFASTRFHAGCGSGGADAWAGALDDLDRALPPGNHERTWVVLHIPPGVDAHSTVRLAHGLAIVPFLDPRARDRLMGILTDPRRNVTLAIAGHTHKFGFRLLPGPGRVSVPVLQVPALSPIFGNNPMFLTGEVASDGTLGSIVEYAYSRGAWFANGGSRDLGIGAFTAPALRGLEGRLAGDSALRAVYARLYDGGARPEITPENWRGYWCAIGSINDTAYRGCVGKRGFGFLTARGVLVLSLGGLAVLMLLVAAGVAAARLGRLARRARTGR